MVPSKSLDQYKLIAALLCDVHSLHGAVFNCRALRLTLQKVQRRVRFEGSRFLTVALPRLGKAFDKAISGGISMNSSELGFKTQPASKLPRFLGEFFSRVLSDDGVLLQNPCADSVRVIRQICYLYYKYELPYTDEQCQNVLSKFKQTEQELYTVDERLRYYTKLLVDRNTTRLDWASQPADNVDVARRAKILLSSLFSLFDPKNICPRHGPGAVATRQQLWDKYSWTNVSANITKYYPLDEYFYSCLGHICDATREINSLTDEDLPARVILVPKDSRGPRLISCEPVDYQWIQQGLGRALVSLVESHPLTKGRVNFTSQLLNRAGAFVGSKSGQYATLDLNEASDRVSVELVRLLFPSHIFCALMSCRSSSTVLPSGEVLPLKKFAPMGSCLCFPIMALTIWAILAAAVPGNNPETLKTFEGQPIAVYGDDVIVPTAQAANAIELLESFGLKINRDKSCTGGLFRESCGADAFDGRDVTPVRLRTVWSSSRCPNAYPSWVAYANSFWDKRYYITYDYIVGLLHRVYGDIPEGERNSPYPSLRAVDFDKRPKRFRTNISLQKRECYIWVVKSPSLNKTIAGWSMLLRFFAESGSTSTMPWEEESTRFAQLSECREFKVRLYTRPRTSMLVRRWR